MLSAADSVKAYPILHKDVFKGVALVLGLSYAGHVCDSCIGWSVAMHDDPRRFGPVDRLQILQIASECRQVLTKADLP